MKKINMEKMLKHRHKWNYSKLIMNESSDVYVRHCKCGMVEYRKYHLVGIIWSGAILFTEKGAEIGVPGYAEK